MTELAYVDSLPAVQHALRHCAGAWQITDNPMLAADPRLPAAVECIDLNLLQGQANGLATAAVHIATDIDRRLVAAGIDRRPGLVPGHLRLAGTTSRLLSSLLYRATVMANHLHDNPPTALHLIIGDGPRFDPLQPFHLPYLASPLRPLAEAGFFGDMPVRLTLQPAPTLDRINDTALDDIIGRLALLPMPAILFDLVHRFRLPLPAWRGPLFVLGENDTIRETLPRLATRGFAIRRLGRLHSARVGNLDYAETTAGESFSDPPPKDAQIAQALNGCLARHIHELGIFDDSQTTALAQVTQHHLAAGMARLTAQIPKISHRLRTVLAGVDHPVILTNGLLGPVGAQVYGLCKTLAATIVDFEHGITVGLAAGSQGRIEFGEVATSDTLICCTQRSRKSFAAAHAAAGRQLEVVGVADQQRRVLRRSLQRQRARRRVPARYRGSETVMHVSTLLWGGNMRATIDPPTESRIWQIDRTLIAQTYENLNKPVLFKPYPTRRFAHQPDYPELFPGLTNVAFLGDEDFRYLRAMPAVLVTSVPTSTLGWCVGTDRPLVYLGSRHMNAILDDALQAGFEAAFFYIDLDRADWPDRLAALLGQPLSEIQDLWAAKAAARAPLLDQALIGPAHPGRRAAKLVATIAGRRQDRDTSQQPANKAVVG